MPSGSFGRSFSASPLSVTKLPLYETRDVWAEESGALGDNSAEWSFGNGATGFIGLPFDDGWEIFAIYLQGDAVGTAAGNDVNVDVRDFQSNNAGIAVASISMDQGGPSGNGHQFDAIATPVPIPNGAVLGFLTTTETGVNSDFRVGLRARRQVGEYVSDVS